MSEKWRSRADSKSRGFDDENEVKSPQSRDNRQTTNEREGGHGHRHKSKDHRKHERRSRSKHASRSRSRSREKDNYKRSRDREGFTSRDLSGPERYNSGSRSAHRFPGREGETHGSKRSLPEQNSNEEQSALEKLHAEGARLKEEVERRKLLFGRKDKPAPASTPAAWQSTSFSDDKDGKVSAKFKRLMGMKDGEAQARGGQSSSSDPPRASDVSKQTQEYMENLEKQYEVARATTHTQRGLGLGYSSGRLWPK